jgi:hypothetical protein
LSVDAFHRTLTDVADGDRKTSPAGAVGGVVSAVPPAHDWPLSKQFWGAMNVPE